MNRTMLRTKPVQEYLSIRDVAEELGVDYKVIYRLVREGTLPSLRIGWQYRIHPDDLQAYLQSRSIGTPGRQDQSHASFLQRNYHHRIRTTEVDRETARLMEQQMIARFQEEVRRVVEIRHPATDVLVTIQNAEQWNDYEEITEDRRGVMDALNVAFLDRHTLDTTPRNTRIRYRVPIEPPFSLELHFRARLARLCGEEVDKEPLHLDELTTFLEELLAEEEPLEVFRVIGLASPTGWDEEAVIYVEHPEQGGFEHRNMVIFLLDLHGEKISYPRADERAVRWSKLFEQILRIPEPLAA